MIEWLQHSSKAIRGFPLGDPHERRFPVYLPPNYSPKNSQPYPVVFMLAGWSGRGARYLQEESVFVPTLDQRFDRAISEHRMSPFIGVLVDGSSKLGCSQYLNSPSIGNYMDYICDELVNFIDSKFHTHKSADYRCVAGHSSGGFGAFNLGFRRPDVFPWLCSSAGDSFFELCFWPLIPGGIEEIEKAGGSPAEFVEKFLAEKNPSNLGGKKFNTMLLLSMACCFAPNPKVPVLFGDVFFDTRTGAIRPDIWKKYLAWDPIHMADEFSSNLKKLKFVLLEAGTGDEYGLQLGHRQIARKFEQYGVPFELNEYPGGHSGHHWRFEERLTKILGKMTT